MTYDIDQLDIELRKTEAGTRILQVFNRHVDEVFYLVGHHRQVMVTWQRNQGPAFISSVLETGFSPDSRVKQEINGVTFSALLRRMAAALQDAGSPALREAVGKHTALVLRWAEKCSSLRELLEELKRSNALPETTVFDK